MDPWSSRVLTTRCKYSPPPPAIVGAGNKYFEIQRAVRYTCSSTVIIRQAVRCCSYHTSRKLMPPFFRFLFLFSGRCLAVPNAKYQNHAIIRTRADHQPLPDDLDLSTHINSRSGTSIINCSSCCRLEAVSSAWSIRYLLGWICTIQILPSIS